MITGLNISSVSANRATNDAVTNMKFNINFDDVKLQGDTLAISFTYMTDYLGGQDNSKHVGELKIVGTLFAKEDKKRTDEILKVWQEKHTIPIEFAEDALTFLNFDCSSRGTLVAWSIGFAAPLPLTRIKLQEQPPEQK